MAEPWRCHRWCLSPFILNRIILIHTAKDLCSIIDITTSANKNELVAVDFYAWILASMGWTCSFNDLIIMGYKLDHSGRGSGLLNTNDVVSILNIAEL